MRTASWIRLAVSVSCTLACTLVLFGLVLGPAVIIGDSMFPAFREKDITLYLRTQKRYKAGDAVILEAASDSPREGLTRAASFRRIVKRVVALPGDTVDISPLGGLFVNGEQLIEPYAVGATLRKELEYPLRLGPGEYFVLGDNREHSADSRSFGAVPANQIEGRVLGILRAHKP